MEILQNFVAFSEYMNFNYVCKCIVYFYFCSLFWANLTWPLDFGDVFNFQIIIQKITNGYFGAYTFTPKKLNQKNKIWREYGISAWTPSLSTNMVTYFLEHICYRVCDVFEKNKKPIS